MLKATRLARSTYHYRLKWFNRANKDKKVKEIIQTVYGDHKGNYDHRRIHLELRNRGFVINHKEV